MIQESSFYIDSYAHKTKFLGNIDVRIKLAFTVLYIAISLFSPSIFVPLTMISILSGSLFIIRPPKVLLIGRLLFPFIMSLIIIISQGIIYGKSIIFSISLGDFQIGFYQEGIIHGVLMASRIMAAVMMMVVLSITTPFNDIVAAAKWFKIPQSLIEIAMLTYRYLFVLWDEVIRIISAQRLRLGYPQWRKISKWQIVMKSVSTLMGMLLIRAFDRSGSSYEAMCLRGYKGYVHTVIDEGWGIKQIKEILVFSSILILLLKISF